MKTMKSLFYGLLLVTGLVACSKEYNSNPAGNANAFGGSNPVAPITGAGTDEMVFKENGQIVRISGVKYTENNNVRLISGVKQEGSKVIGYTLVFSPYLRDANVFTGSGNIRDTFSFFKIVGDASDPNGEVELSYYTGGFTTAKNIGGYAYTKITDTANNKMKGEFTGRLVRRDPNDADKELSEFLDITSGFYNATKFEP